MKTDHLDLWQVHDVRTDDDIKEIFGPRGAIEAFSEAKQKGLIRFIGVTGHHDPEILKKCINLFDFDTVLLPVNPAEQHYKSFLDEVAPFAGQKGMGIIGMKVYFRGFAARLPWFQSMEPFLHFALSQPVSTVVIGCDSIPQLEENVLFAVKFKAMRGAKMRDLIGKVKPFSRQLMYYKP
jgi:predicted aldo/keto reductase-like oxidoreductase